MVTRKTEASRILRCIVLLMLVSIGTSDFAKDKQECANQLVGLATCLPYVGGDAKTPTMDCCTGLNQILKTNKKCLCILVKDKDDPSLGLKINSTLALGLPVKCKSPNRDISECPALLHLAPKSADSKVFDDYAKAQPPASSTPALTDKPSDSSSTGTTTPKGPSNGGVAKRWLIVQMLSGFLLWFFTYHFIP